MNLGQRVYDLRKLRGLSARALAEGAGISCGQVTAIEVGRTTNPRSAMSNYVSCGCVPFALASECALVRLGYQAAKEPCTCPCHDDEDAEDDGGSGVPDEFPGDETCDFTEGDVIS